MSLQCLRAVSWESGRESVDGNVEHEIRGCEVSERSLKTLLAPFAVLNLDSMVLVAGAEESAVVNKMSELIRTLCT